MAELTFTLPIKTVSEANSRGDWRVRFFKRTKPHREAARLSMMSVTRKLVSAGALLPVTVRLARVASRELDGDNLQGALKAVRDGIADALGIADNDPRVTWLYAQEKCARGRYAVRVSVKGS